MNASEYLKAEAAEYAIKQQSLLREFPTGQAVVVNRDGSVVWQLAKIELVQTGIILTYPTKKAALQAAKSMGFRSYSVERFSTSMGFYYWAIHYDFRLPYYIACWEV